MGWDLRRLQRCCGAVFSPFACGDTRMVTARLWVVWNVCGSAGSYAAFVSVGAVIAYVHAHAHACRLS